jgi:hypothetical protein
MFNVVFGSARCRLGDLGSELMGVAVSQLTVFGSL